MQTGLGSTPFTLSAEILPLVEAEDAGGLAPVKDDNKEQGQKLKLKAGSYSSPQLRAKGVEPKPVCTQQISLIPRQAPWPYDKYALRVFPRLRKICRVQTAWHLMDDDFRVIFAMSEAALPA